MTQTPSIIQKAEFNPAIKTYIFIVVAFFLFITIAGIPILIFWLLGLGQMFSKKYYNSLECELQEKHLRFQKGVLFKVEKTIPLENIQDLTFIDNPFLKIFDLRILKIETAGQSNPQGSDMKLIGIINASEFKNRVLEQRENLQNRQIHSTTPETHSDSELLNVLQEIRDVLKEIKTNTDHKEKIS